MARATVGVLASQAEAAGYKQNPFTLVYEGAITKNDPGESSQPEAAGGRLGPVRQYEL